MELGSRQETSQTPNVGPSLPLNHNGVRVVVVVAVFVPLATIAVALRFYARFLKRVSHGLEDWFLLASTERCPSSSRFGIEPNIFQQILFYAYSLTSILAVCIGGIGYHVNEMGSVQLQRGLKVGPLM